MSTNLMAAAIVALSLRDKFTGPMKQPQGALKDFERQAKQTEGTLARLAQGMGDFAQKWGGRGALAAGGGLAYQWTEAWKGAIDAEKALAGVVVTSGLAGKAAAASMQTLKGELIGVSKETNQLQSDLTRSLASLVSAGLGPDQAMKLLRPIGHAALATGADVEDLGKSLYATYQGLKVPISDAGQALEIMAKAGSMGSFELKSMAQYFPQLTSAASSLNMKGTEGLASVAAALQVAMKGAGSESEAANNLANFMKSLNSPETVKNFEKMGVNVRKLRKEAEASGDPLAYYAETIQRITGGDALKLGQLFGDAQAQNFIRPMIQSLEDYKRIKREAQSSKGFISQAEVTQLATAAEQLKRLQVNTEASAQGFDGLGFSVGKFTEALKALNDMDLTKLGMLAGAAAAAGAVWLGGALLRRRKGKGGAEGPEGGLGGGLAGYSMANPLPVYVVNKQMSLLPETLDGDGSGRKPSGGKKPGASAAKSLAARAREALSRFGKSVRGARFGLGLLQRLPVSQLLRMGALGVGTAAAGVTSAGLAGYSVGSGANWLMNKGFDRASDGKSKSLGEWLYNKVYADELAELSKPIQPIVRRNASGAGLTGSGPQQPVTAEVAGAIRIEIDSRGVPRVTQVQSGVPGLDIQTSVFRGLAGYGY